MSKKKQSFLEKCKPALENTKEVLTRVWKWSFNIRSVLLAIPVAIGAVVLAIRNMILLPKQVGIVLLASGEFSWSVSRGVAVLGPLAVTAVCLLLMFISRKTVYPWLVSLFSLLLPILLWIINTFPA